MTERRFSWQQVVAATNVANRLSALFERLSVPITFVLVNHSTVSANGVTRVGALCGLSGSALFLLGQPLAAGAAFAAFLLLDCTDGAVARLRGAVSMQGADLDLWADRMVLLLAALAFGWVFTARGDGMAAWLCTAYLAAHYLTDIGWLTSERRRADLPPQFTALTRQLHGAAGQSNPPRAVRWGMLGQAYRLVRSVAPTPWVCNIIFLLGPCLAPWPALYSLAAAIVAILGWLALVRLQNMAARAR